MSILAGIRHVLWVVCGCLGVLSLTSAAALVLCVARDARRTRRRQQAPLSDAQFEAELYALLRDAGGT